MASNTLADERAVMMNASSSTLQVSAQDKHAPPPTTSASSAFHPTLDPELLLDCVHCGLCTSACPTYLELGTEMDSPRGRIYLMRKITEGSMTLDHDTARHLELCLDCRACESACPSGVQYGRLIEPFKIEMQRAGQHAKPMSWLQRALLTYLFPYASRMRWAIWPARIMQRVGLDRMLEKTGIFNLLPTTLAQMQKMLPGPNPASQERPLHDYYWAKGTKRATVALLTGCVGDAIFRPVHWATVRVLQENGCDVIVPKGDNCCGAIHYHSGLEAQALATAQRNIDALNLDQVDAIITNVAGCGAMLKDYGHLPVPTDQKERFQKFASKVKDINEYLVTLGIRPPKCQWDVTATYHDACHLCHAQQIRSAPRQLLSSINGLKLVPLDESEVCCGAAGAYNLLEPEMANRLGNRKANHIQATNSQIVFIANAGCSMHIGRKLREQSQQTGKPMIIAHPVEALDRAYRGLSMFDQQGT